MKQGWEIKKLGEVCDVLNGLWIGKKEPFVNICVIRNTNFTKDCKLNLDNVAYIDAEVKQFATRKLKVGDIIIEKSGGSDKQPVGRVVLFDIDSGDYSFSNFTSALRIKSDVELNHSYLHKCLYAHYLRGETFKLQSKTTGLHNLDMKGYLRLPIPVPPLPEQEKIVSELDCLSGIIEKKRQQLKELDALAQSIFYEMFGDPNLNNKKWEEKKISEICTNLDYKRRPITAKDRISGSIPYYGASGIVDFVEDYIFDGAYLLVSEDGANLLMRSTPIAFSISGKTWVNNHAHVLEFDESSKRLFVEYFLNLLDLSDIVRGCAQPKLTQASLNEIKLFDVPSHLQQTFASKIEAIEKQKALIKQSLGEVETLFNARMQEYFG